MLPLNLSCFMSKTSVRLAPLGAFLLCFFLLGLSALSFAQDPSAYMLDNGVIRFGGQGHNSTSYNTANSIVASGMLQQPHYRSADGTWYKLTFSTDLPLSMTVGTGTGSSNWTGSVIPESGAFDNFIGLNTLSNLAIDASGFTTTRTVGDIAAGYGALVVSGTVDINGQAMGIQHRYELGQTDAFSRITTRVTNESEAVMANVNVWLGTRDDWVGNSDAPTKIRGNIVDGQFEEISAASEPSSALLIQSGDEAVLFYSTTPNVNTVWDSCCSFRNAYNADPSTKAPNSGARDGSYAIYLPVGDLQPGESRNIVWFYAAGSLEDIGDIIGNVAQAAGSVDNIGTNSADFEVSSSEDGVGYWMVVPEGSVPPTEEEIAAGVNYGGVTVTTSGNLPLVQDVAETIQLSPLAQGTPYTVYFVIETLDGDQPVFSDVVSDSFTTLLPPPASVTVVPGDEEVTVSWSAVMNADEYEVAGDPDGSCVISAPATSCVIDGLTNDVSYTFTVVARNASVSSEPSAPSSAVLPGAMPALPVPVFGPWAFWVMVLSAFLLGVFRLRTAATNTSS